jgi:hypothetical protein
MLLRPGVTCADAVKFLENLMFGSLNDVQNALPRIGTLEALDLTLPVRKYDTWTGQAAREIRTVFADLSIAARLRSGRYGHILATSPNPNALVLLLAELSDLRDYFNETANQLRELQARFAHHKGRTLVLDCNDVLHYQRFDTIPWTRLYRPGCVIAFPHVIVDEIDKKAYDTGSDTVRGRARGVYRLLEQLQDEMDEKGYATLKDGTVVEVIADEVGHERLSNNDNEAIACAGLLQAALAPGQVTVVTRDLGVRARARTWKLKAEALPEKYLIPGGGFTAADLDQALTLITPVAPADGSEANST